MADLDYDLENGEESLFLNKKQIKALELMAEGVTNISKIARLCEVNRRTVYNWMKSEKFKTELHKMEQSTIEQAKQEFSRKLPQAVNEYWKLCLEGDKRTKEMALRYWIDRSLGKIPGELKVEDSRSDSDDFDIAAALKDLKLNNETDNVIPLAKAAGS